MRQLKEFYRIYFSDPKTRLSVALTLLAIVGLLVINGTSKDPAKAADVGGDASDFIPAGFTLHAIELQNQEGLDAMIGGYAYVDLILPGTEGRPAQKVGRRLKLVRLPQNPSKFAVLISEEKATALVAYAQPLIAVILSKEPTPIKSLTLKSSPRIHVYPEEKK